MPSFILSFFAFNVKINLMRIAITNGSVEYDGIPVLERVDFVVNDNEKIALVGRNGSGKTTLLKALTGEVDLVKGTGDSDLSFTMVGNPVVGFLKQTARDDEKRTMREEVLSAYQDLRAVEKAMDDALQVLQNDGSEKNAAAYSRLHERFEREGGYTYKKEYLTAVRKFGFSDDDLDKPLVCFSGGQRTKIALVKLLLSKPDVLLLDEPTNHLDLEGIEWLEKYLADYKKSCVIVSHDRMFLDKIVNVVYEIEYGETTRYSGNYSAFVEQKKDNYDKALKDALLRKKEIERLQKVVDRFRYKAHKAAMAQAKLKQIERIGKVDIPVGYDKSTFKGMFQPTVETVRNTVIMEHLSFGYGKPLGEINTIVEKGQKVGIIGPNGSGKSTLIRTIMKLIPPLDGHVRFGLHAEVGYFDQTKTQSFSPLTVLEDFKNDFPSYTDGEARTALGAFLFSGDDVFKTVGDLSGGEKVRLALLKIFKRRPNVLILDEPTNHMDIIGKETLEKMLAEYEGTVITVSHDRYFVNKVCSRLLVFEKDGLKAYDCGYSEYERLVAEKDSDSDDNKKVVAKKGKPISAERERAKRQHRIEVLESKMSAIDEKISALKKTMTEDASVFSDYKKLTEIENEIAALEKEQEPFAEEWERLIQEE